jgi:hypothetical protein
MKVRRPGILSHDVEAAGVEPACIQLLFQQLRKPRRYAPMKECHRCTTKTNNPKYCSRSCAAIENNSRAPKRKKKIRLCTNCTTEPVPRRAKYCPPCRLLCRNPGPDSDDFLKLTKEEALTKDTQRYSNIRKSARRIARAAGLLSRCAICSYSLWVETCHRAPIKSFSSTTLVEVINAVENLIGLCPNHHWEFDNGHLILPPASVPSQPTVSANLS